MSEAKYGICPICEGPLAKYFMNYGAKSCMGCRAFFRRSVPMKDTYFCKFKKNNCVITGNQRGKCRKCRFTKCLQVGMNPNAVLDEEGKEKRFWRLIEKNKKLVINKKEDKSESPKKTTESKDSNQSDSNETKDKCKTLSTESNSQTLNKPIVENDDNFSTLDLPDDKAIEFLTEKRSDNEDANEILIKEQNNPIVVPRQRFSPYPFSAFSPINKPIRLDLRPHYMSRSSTPQLLPTPVHFYPNFQIPLLNRFPHSMNKNVLNPREICPLDLSSSSNFLPPNAMISTRKRFHLTPPPLQGPFPLQR